MCSIVAGSFCTAAASSVSAHHFRTRSTASSTLGTRAHSIAYPVLALPDTSSRQSASSLAPTTMHSLLPGGHGSASSPTQDS